MQRESTSLQLARAQGVLEAGQRFLEAALEGLVSEHALL